MIHANGTHRGVEKQLLSETKFTHWFEIPGLQYLETEGNEEPIESSEVSESTAGTPIEPTDSPSANPSEVIPTEESGA